MDSKRKITEAEPARRPPEAASAAQISAVLGNDDILREILLRLDFPTCLVRAAAVSKRWLRHASDPAFLRRFRRLHRPRLLGFYIHTSDGCLARFIPLPQPPELAAVIRRGNFDLGRDSTRYVSDCRNGCLIYIFPQFMPDNRRGQTTVFRPLHPGRGATVLSPLQIPSMSDGNVYSYARRFLFHDDDSGDGMAVYAVTVIHNAQQAMLQLQDSQAGHWGTLRSSNLIQPPGQWKRCQHSTLLANGKIYVICMVQYILGLDVQSMTLFSIELPNGVEYDYDSNIALSRAEGSGFRLVHVKMFQISVWQSMNGRIGSLIGCNL